MRKLNFGCGNDKKEGWLNVDIDSEVKPDMVLDDKGLIVFLENEFDEIYCRNVLEHIPNQLNFIEQIHRILKPNGKATIITDNASFILFHGLKRHRHDTYNIKHTCYEDNHYAIFFKGHLEALFKKRFLNPKVDYYIADTRRFYPSRLFQLIGGLVSKRLFYSNFIIEVKK